MKEKLEQEIFKNIIGFTNDPIVEKYAELLGQKEAIQAENYDYDEDDLKEAGYEYIIGQDDISILSQYSDEMVQFYLDKLEPLEYEIRKKIDNLANAIEIGVRSFLVRSEISVTSGHSYTRSRYIDIRIEDLKNNQEFQLEIRFSDHEDRHYWGNRATLSYDASEQEIKTTTRSLISEFNWTEMKKGGQTHKQMTEQKSEVKEPRTDLPELAAANVQNADADDNSYIAQSASCRTVKTIIPASMRYDMLKAIETVDRRVNGVDEFVAGKLGYYTGNCDANGYKEGVKCLCDAFSAEQVDALAVSIYNIEEKGQGVIIADQTGIGKGRIAAGLIRYGLQQGILPIFLTEKPNLFSDMFRDLIDIGSDAAIPLEVLSGHREVSKKATNVEADTEDEAEEEGFEQQDTQIVRVPVYKANKNYDQDIIGKTRAVPFIINGRTSRSTIKDEHGHILYKGLPKSQNDSVIKAGIVPQEYNFAMGTYSQFRGAVRNAKMDYLEKIAQGAIFIMDESHNASGSSNTGEFLRKVLSGSKGVQFLSATFAKRPDNMPIYASKTSMADANLSNEGLVDAITAGGVALQEIVASQLVSEGQLIRRERSFDGIAVNWIYLDATQDEAGRPDFNLEQRHRVIMDNSTEIIRDIMAFQATFVDTEIAAMDKIAKAEYKEVEQREGTQEGGINNQPVFSGIFHIISQLLFSIKAEAVAKQAVERMKQGKKPIIAFANTMESFLNTMTNDEGQPVVVGEVINSDFSRIFARRLESVLRYTEIDPDGNRTYSMVDVASMDELFRLEHGRIIAKINTASIGISSSPIDILRHHIHEAGFTTLEVTGRDRQLKFVGKDKAEIQARMKVAANDAFRQFNDNEIDCLLINQSGSTGASAHAKSTPKVPNDKVKPRAMIILQPELNINTEIQKRGRINRTGQIYKPEYDYVVSSIPAEKRLMMMLQKKLKSLDANVSSNQKESKKVINVQDFLNKYGDTIAEQYLRDNPLINIQIGDPLKLQELEEGETSDVLDAAQKVSGRVAILPIKDQENFYNDMGDRYVALVEYLIQTGEYDLEVENMNLEAKTLEKEIVIVGKGGDSVFGRHSILEKCEVNNLRKPFTKEEVDGLIKASLDGQEPLKLQQSIINKYEKFVKFHLDTDLAENTEHYATLTANVAKEKKILDITDSADLSRAIVERKEALESARSEISTRIIKISNNKSENIMRALNFYHVGKVVGYPGVTYGDDGTYYKGVFVGFDINDSAKNPYAPSAMKIRVAILSSQRYIAVPVSKFEIVTAIRAITYESIYDDDQQTLLERWDELAAEKSADRTRRYIITGNILQAFGNKDYKGSLISYTTDSNSVKKGILLPEGFSTDANYRTGKEAMRITVPIIKALPIIKSMVQGRSITTTDGFGIYKSWGGFRISVPASKKKGGKFFLDKTILKLTTDGLFNKSGSQMIATVEEGKIPNLVKYLQDQFNSSVELIPQEFDKIKGDIEIKDYADEETTVTEQDQFLNELTEEAAAEEAAREAAEAEKAMEDEAAAAEQARLKEQELADREKELELEKQKLEAAKKMLNLARLMQGKELLMALGGKTEDVPVTEHMESHGIVSFPPGFTDADKMEHSVVVRGGFKNTRLGYTMEARDYLVIEDRDYLVFEDNQPERNTFNMLDYTTQEKVWYWANDGVPIYEDFTFKTHKTKTEAMKHNAPIYKGRGYKLVKGRVFEYQLYHVTEASGDLSPGDLTIKESVFSLKVPDNYLLEQELAEPIVEDMRAGANTAPDNLGKPWKALSYYYLEIPWSAAIFNRGYSIAVTSGLTEQQARDLVESQFGGQITFAAIRGTQSLLKREGVVDEHYLESRGRGGLIKAPVQNLIDRANAWIGMAQKHEIYGVETESTWESVYDYDLVEVKGKYVYVVRRDPYKTEGEVKSRYNTNNQVHLDDLKYDLRAIAREIKKGFRKEGKRDLLKDLEYGGRVPNQSMHHGKFGEWVDHVFIIHKDDTPLTDFNGLTHDQAQELYITHQGDPNTEIINWDRNKFDPSGCVTDHEGIKMHFGKYESGGIVSPATLQAEIKEQIGKLMRAISCATTKTDAYKLQEEIKVLEERLNFIDEPRTLEITAANVFEHADPTETEEYDNIALSVENYDNGTTTLKETGYDNPEAFYAAMEDMKVAAIEDLTKTVRCRLSQLQ